MSDKQAAVIILVVIAVIAIGAVIINLVDSCDGMEMPDGTCVWVPDGTKVDGNTIGE